MSLQRRLLLYLLLCAPLVWGAGLWVSAQQAREEVNELFDAQIIRLGRQVQATLGATAAPTGDDGDLGDASVAAWNARGELLLADREGAQLPYLAQGSGFRELRLDGALWRVYYLPPSEGGWRVASGQRLAEREELVWGLLASQLVPWLLALPLLLAAMAWAVRQALAPMRALAADLHDRGADDLRPLAADGAPAELQPLLAAMNGLFRRIATTLDRERRFTADAAHELRTPLAALRAQWDVLHGAASAGERAEAEARLAAGLDRVDRLVTQLLALSRLEATEALPRRTAMDWPALVAQAMDDVLPLAERRGVELGCDWPPDGRPAFPLQGDPGLMAVLLRNLLDNAVRYAPPGGSVTLRFAADTLVVENDGPALPQETLDRLGERFHRPDGQAERGSGLGVSIVQRVAALHGLQLRYGAARDGSGVVAELGRPRVGPGGL